VLSGEPYLREPEHWAISVSTSTFSIAFPPFDRQG
jgi:hypothetical protein